MRAILTYHSIDESRSPISVSRRDFLRQVEWLEGNGVAVVSIPELVALPDDANAVAFTFDDGITSVAEEAAPILADRQWPATVYVVADRLGQTNQWSHPGDARIPVFPLLDVGALDRLQRTGFEIGSHGSTHRSLVGGDALLLRDEVETAAERLDRIFSVRPRTFAYPYGLVDGPAAAAVARAHRYACTTQLSELRSISTPLRLPRLDAYYLRGPVLRTRWGGPSLRAYLAVRRTIRALRQPDR